MRISISNLFITLLTAGLPAAPVFTSYKRFVKEQTARQQSCIVRWTALKCSSSTSRSRGWKPSKADQ